jgi:pyruvate/2-oxoglutarate dehydrogenase complex dihydrolipoamide acyltransferase (E2) component
VAGWRRQNRIEKGKGVMAVEIRLQKLAFSMDEGVLQEWLAEDGAAVSEGQPLYLLENEKSAHEVEAPASGTLRILVHPSDEALPVGTVLGTIG